MAGVEEVRAGIALAGEKAQEAVAALEQAKLAVGEAEQALVSATGGSGQDDIQHAQGALNQASEEITGVQGIINGATDSAGSYAGRL